MTPEQYISLYLQPTLEPVLTSDELALIIELAKTVDSDGNKPTDPDWTPTYDYSSAISRGWTIKAAKVAGNYQFKDDTLELHREQVYTNCLKMASEWASKSTNDGPGAIQSGGITAVNLKPTQYKPWGTTDYE